MTSPAFKEVKYLVEIRVSLQVHQLCYQLMLFSISYDKTQFELKHDFGSDLLWITTTGTEALYIFKLLIGARD